MDLRNEESAVVLNDAILYNCCCVKLLFDLIVCLSSWVLSFFLPTLKAVQQHASAIFGDNPIESERALSHCHRGSDRTSQTVVYKK